MDVVLEMSLRFTTMHVVLFANVVEDRLPECPIQLRLIGPTMPTPLPLHIGIQFRGDNVASDGSGVGALEAGVQMHPPSNLFLSYMR
jgi:hypothetical protein